MAWRKQVDRGTQWNRSTERLGVSSSRELTEDKTDRSRDIFLDDEKGYTTLTTVVCIALAIVLLFSASQVNWTQRESSDIQFVADAGALAAENVVAEYYTIARVADAVILSMSLFTLTMYGVATALCCIPVTVEAGMTVMSYARQAGSARDKVATSAAKALDTAQTALPYVCAANSAAVISNNSDDTSNYVGLAITLPLDGDDVEFGGSEELSEASSQMEQSNTEASEHAAESDEATQQMDNAKLAAYMADCGNNPSYCMYQRASTLAGLDGASNPHYSSVEYWSFSVALDRAKAYYNARLANESPQGSSLEESVRSQCRKVFYSYAVEQMASAYVVENEGAFSANFPLLPKNTSEMKQTSIYTNSVWPVSADGVIHGSTACPAYQSAGASGAGSLQQLDAGTYTECSRCNFSSSTMGKIGAASSNIQNGFEYYYRIVAEEAEKYEQAFNKAAQEQQQVKESAEQSYETFEDAIKKITGADKRYSPKPPGRYGCICVVVDLQQHESPQEFQTSLMSTSATIQPRIAMSAAALAEDPANDESNVISSMLDGVYQDTIDSGGSGIFEGSLSWLMGLWGSALQFYGNGVEAFSQGIEDVINSIPLIGSTPLGSWAKNAFLDTLENLGLQPAELSSPKPVTVNTQHVLQQANTNLASTLAFARDVLNTDDVPQTVAMELLGDSSISIDLGYDTSIDPAQILGTVLEYAGVLE